MNDDASETASELRPGEVAIQLPAVTDAGVYFIGTIHTPWHRRSECPKRGSADGPICSIVVDERWREALTDIARHRRIQVLYLDASRAARSGTADAISYARNDRDLCLALAGAAKPDCVLHG